MQMLTLLLDALCQVVILRSCYINRYIYSGFVFLGFLSFTEAVIILLNFLNHQIIRRIDRWNILFLEDSDKIYSDMNYVLLYFGQEQQIYCQIYSELMKKPEETELSMSRLYDKLNQLASRLNQKNQHSVRLNFDVPINDCTNLTINLKNHTCQASSRQLKQQLQVEQISRIGQTNEEEQYIVKVNAAHGKSTQSIYRTFQDSTSNPYYTVKIQQTLPRQPQAQQEAVTQFKPSSTQRPEAFENQKKQVASDTLAKAWQIPVSSSKTEQHYEKRYLSPAELSQSPIDKKKDQFAYSPSHGYTRSSFYNSEALLSNFTTEVKHIEEIQNESLSASKKTAEEYSNRLHALNQKLKNSFMRVEHWQIRQIPVKQTKIQTKKSKKQITPLKKTLDCKSKKKQQPKLTVSSLKKAETAKSSRMMLNSSQCSCSGQRIRRSKRSISPFFKNSEYKYNLIENIYKKTQPKKSEQPIQQNLTFPSNCRNVKFTSESMSNFIKDVRKNYKERTKTEIQAVNFETLDKNKKYNAHRLQKSPSKSKSTVKQTTQTRSVSPLHRYQHRCLACCNYP